MTIKPLSVRITAYAERARVPPGVVLYVNLNKDGVRCCAAHQRAYEALARLAQVGAVDIAGVYRVDSLCSRKDVEALMQRDLKEIDAWE